MAWKRSGVQFPLAPLRTLATARVFDGQRKHSVSGFSARSLAMSVLTLADKADAIFGVGEAVVSASRS